MASIPSLLYAIMQAPVNATGEIQWFGTYGQANILTNIVETIRDRGVYFIPIDAQGNPNTTALALLGASDTRLAIVQDLAMYYYDSNGGNPTTGSIQSGSGGLWRVIFYLPTTGNEYTKTIGDSVSTSFSVQHNLNTLTPTVICQFVLGGLPYSNIQPSAYDYSIVDANNIIFTFIAAPASVSTQVIIKV